MWIHAIKGMWFLHPFWRAKFLLEHADDLAAIRRSRITRVVIDTDKGLDVLEADVLEAAATPVDRQHPVARPAAVAGAARSAVSRRIPATAWSAPAPPPARSKPVPPQSCDMAAELGRATRTARKARKLMSHLFHQVRLGQGVDSTALSPLVDEMADSLTRNNATLASVLRLKRKDEYTYMHSVTVAALMINLARELGHSERQAREAGLAGLLHDIGKTGIDDAILNKPGALTDDEYTTMRSHPERGHAALRRDEALPLGVMDVALHHHERFDGKGYPHKLKGDEISLLARMGAVCDVYDAVTSDRPYKAPWTPAEAIARMKSWQGHFDDRVLNAFIRTIGKYPVGSLVRLKSDRLAVVTGTVSATPDLPLVRAFASAVPGKRFEPEDIALAGGSDAITSAEKPADWDYENWEERWPAIARASLKSLRAAPTPSAARLAEAHP